MTITQIGIAMAAALGAAAVELVAAPPAVAAPSPLPKVCVVVGEAVACPSTAPAEIGNFPGVVRYFPFGYLPALGIGQR